MTRGLWFDLCLVAVILLLSGCATGNAKQDQINAANWASLIKPQDPVPAECVKEPAREPKMDKKAHKASEAAREDRKVRLALRSIRRDYKRCQTWAKGQR